MNAEQQPIQNKLEPIKFSYFPKVSDDANTHLPDFLAVIIKIILFKK